MADLPDYYTQIIALEAEAFKFRGGADTSKSADPTSRDVYFATDTQILYVCVVDGAWVGLDAATLTKGILTLYEDMDADSNQISNLPAPVANNDAARKVYVDTLHALCLLLTGGTMSGDIAMGAHKITGLAAPTLANDAVRKAYADLFTLLTTFNTHEASAIIHHTKYTNGEAVAAAEAAGLALASGKNIKVISALASDHTWSGLTAVMTAGTALGYGQACYVGGDGKLEFCDARDAAKMPAICIATASIAENAAGEVLLQGFIRDDDWIYDPGDLVYPSTTPGLLSAVRPYNAGDQVQVVGIAITADIIYFSPSFELVEIS